VTHFPDLSPYRYLSAPGSLGGVPEPDGSLNVGWLSSAHAFPTGDVPDEAVPKILRLVLHHRVNVMRGHHDCELCFEQFGRPGMAVCMDVDGHEVWLGNAEIRVTDRTGVIYASPSLVAHYISAHRYLPPPDFIEAVLDAPVTERPIERSVPRRRWPARLLQRRS